jgi:hypothetical protein
MPKIPLYQRQVRATGQSQPRMSPQAASAPWQAAGQAGQAISQVGGVLADYQKKKQAQENSLLESKYKRSLSVEDHAVELFKSEQIKSGSIATPEQISDLRKKYLEERAGYISEMSGKYKQRYQSDYVFDSQERAITDKIYFNTQTIKKNTEEFKLNVSTEYRLGNFDKAKEMIGEAEWLGKAGQIKMMADVEEEYRISLYNYAIQQPKSIVAQVQSGDISPQDGLDLISEHKKTIESYDLGQGQRGNANSAISSAEKAIDVAQKKLYDSTEKEFKEKLYIGEMVTRDDIQAAVDNGLLDERGASRIEIKRWKMESGVPTSENNAAFGKVISDINNGQINSFEKLEDRYSFITYGQYKQAEAALADRLATSVRQQKVRSWMRDVSDDSSTASTLFEVKKEISNLDVQMETKEALMVIMENEFRLKNKNPELSKAYITSVSNIMELERYLDIPSGIIASREMIYEDMSLEDLQKVEANLKKSFDNQVADKLKEDMKRFSFSKTDNQSDIDIDDILDQVGLGDE